MNTVDLIFNYIKENDYVDDERISYSHLGDYPFSSEEFMVLWNYLDTHYQEDQEDCTDHFPEARSYFQYKGKKYIWRVLRGQGTACQILIGNKRINGPDVSFKEDKKVILPDNLYDFMEKEYDKLIIKEIIE